MNYELSDAQLNNLARDLDSLYDETQKKMGQEDLDYVRNVKKYSEAIERRSFELFNHPDTKNAFQKAVVLRGLHVLIELLGAQGQSDPAAELQMLRELLLEEEGAGLRAGRVHELLENDVEESLQVVTFADRFPDLMEDDHFGIQRADPFVAGVDDGKE